MKNPLNTLLVLGRYLAARRRFTTFRDRAALESWQAKQVQRHLGWVAQRSPFYSAWLAKEKRGPAGELASWPRCDKRLMTENLAAWLTEPVDLSMAREIARRASATRDFTPLLPGNTTVGLSSGTTGPAAMFFVSARERAAWAGLALARTLRELSTRCPQRIAFFLRANSPLYETLGSRAVRFVYFDVQRPIAAALEKLGRMSPTVIVAPPSVLRVLAEAQLSGGLHVLPRQIVSVAEVFDPDDRQVVESAFGVRADEVYQASEGFLAATCPAGSLHWNEDIVQLEREELGGGRYHPVLTDFRRRLQPVIRYRLDDVVTDEPDEMPACACGSIFRRIRRIEGRQDDCLRLPSANGTGVGVLFPDFVRLAVSASASDGLEDFRVQQVGPGLVEIGLRPAPSSPEAQTDFLRRLEQALAADCARAGVRPPVCRWMPWPDAPEGDGSKRRRVAGLPTEDARL